MPAGKKFSTKTPKGTKLFSTKTPKGTKPADSLYKKK